MRGPRTSPPRSTPIARRASPRSRCVASAGTTLTGAVDPIAGLADVCAARGVWLHVDGAYGLPAACAPSARALFAGLERADSVSVDAHKWLYLPKACSIVLVRDKSSLVEAFAHDESYMLHDEDERHAVDTTLEYSRPFRALKLWLALRAHGAEAFRAAIEQNLEQARFLRTLIEGHDDLEVVGTPSLSIVPFRHLPGDGRDVDAHNLALAHAIDLDGRVYVSPAVVDGTRGAAAVHRQLPHDRRRRARARRRRARARRRPRLGWLGRQGTSVRRPSASRSADMPSARRWCSQMSGVSGASSASARYSMSAPSRSSPASSACRSQARSDCRIHW